MNIVLIAHPDIHTATAIEEMIEAILEELSVSQTKTIVATSLNEVMTMVSHASLLLIDDDLFSEVGIQEIRQIPINGRVKIIMVEDRLLIARQMKLRDEIGDLISKPLERSELKETVRRVLAPRERREL
ncbi:MAG: hypothetical protein HY282_07490 [Nitrospirae bacterium]|nr:hypothetical protein [Candidatus Manganitrophaceae bacterium]